MPFPPTRIKSRLQAIIEQVRERVAQSRLARNRLTTLVWQVFLGMGRDDATLLAAGVAYYAIFFFVSPAAGNAGNIGTGTEL